MAKTPEIDTPSVDTPGVDDLDVAGGDDDDDFEGLEDYLKSLEWNHDTVSSLCHVNKLRHLYSWYIVLSSVIVQDVWPY